jgi:hypothetical protein
MSAKTFEAVFPNWREELALQYRAAAQASAEDFADGYKPTNADLAELRTRTELNFLKAIGPAMKKEMGSHLVEEACCIASQAFVERLVELLSVTTLNIRQH